MVEPTKRALSLQRRQEDGGKLSYLGRVLTWTRLTLNALYPNIGITSGTSLGKAWGFAGPLTTSEKS